MPPQVSVRSVPSKSHVRAKPKKVGETPSELPTASSSLQEEILRHRCGKRIISQERRFVVVLSQSRRFAQRQDYTPNARMVTPSRPFVVKKCGRLRSSPSSALAFSCVSRSILVRFCPSQRRTRVEVKPNLRASNQGGAEAASKLRRRKRSPGARAPRRPTLVPGQSETLSVATLYHSCLCRRRHRRSCQTIRSRLSRPCR